jgi:hypothetical protein
MNKDVILPPDVQQKIVEEIRLAKYGEMEAIGVRYGITKARIYYYRKLAGITFTSSERSAYLKTRPKPGRPKRDYQIRKQVGFAIPTRYLDLGPADVAALRRLGYRLNVEEPLKLSQLQARAWAGDLEAFRILYQNYSKLRLPLAENQLTPEQRRELPWLAEAR